MKSQHIYEIFGQDAHEMTIALMEAYDAAAHIPSGASVALKPNLVLPSKPENGAVTHPGVLSGCLDYLFSHGIRNVCIMESSWVGDRTKNAFKMAGYDAVCRKYDVPFYDLKEDTVKTVDTPFGPMEICKRALETDYLIDLPVLKGHCQTRMTCAIKNLKGAIPDREKRRFHSAGLIKPIAALGAALRPQLIIVDSICGDLNFEEGGNPVQTNRMFLGDDAVAIDCYGAKLMGLSLDELPYLTLAANWGAGNADLNSVEIVALNSPQDGADYPMPSGLVGRLCKHVRQDRACSACFASLVRALYLLNREGILVQDEIAIGQGWRGKTFKGIGIGNCLNKSEQTIRGCPPTAEDIARVLRER